MIFNIICKQIKTFYIPYVCILLLDVNILCGIDFLTNKKQWL